MKTIEMHVEVTSLINQHTTQGYDVVVFVDDVKEEFTMMSATQVLSMLKMFELLSDDVDIFFGEDIDVEYFHAS